MTEGRHHRRRDDDHTADGIYFPPPREVPRPRSSPPEPPVPPVPLSPWAPGPGTAGPAKPPEEHPPTAPVYYARASDWTVRPSPWAAADQDEFDGEFDGFDRDAPPSPVPPAQPSPAPQPSPMVQPLPVVQPSQVVQPEPDPPGAFPPPGALTRAATPADRAAAVDRPDGGMEPAAVAAGAQGTGVAGRIPRRTGARRIAGASGTAAEKGTPATAQSVVGDGLVDRGRRHHRRAGHRRGNPGRTEPGPALLTLLKPRSRVR